MPTSGSATMSLIILSAASVALGSDEAILTVPSSSMSILVPETSVISRIILPPGPMMSRILSVGILIVVMRGAKSEIDFAVAA